MAVRLPPPVELAKVANQLTDGSLTRLQHFANVAASRENQTRLQNREFVPAGHFYSAIPDAATRERFIQAPDDDDVCGIDLREEHQLALMPLLARFHEDYPFPENKTDDFRYHRVNGMYSHGDGYFLNAMIRHFKPRRIIEIGSGFSSAMMLDTNQVWFENAMHLSFIEPHCERLKSLLRVDDNQVKIYEQPVQDVSLDCFDSLEDGDFLFVDSTHVSKLCSDVNHIFFNIFPRLADGVIIHVHDIFWPFEYPKKWAADRRCWNELYLLRAFLMGNSNYEITWFNTLMSKKYAELYSQAFPVCLPNAGANFWMKKSAAVHRLGI